MRILLKKISTCCWTVRRSCRGECILKVIRRGHFDKIFPFREQVDYYEKFFDCQRYLNALLWSFLKANPNTVTGC